jgi:hypothetical protein
LVSFSRSVKQASKEHFSLLNIFFTSGYCLQFIFIFQNEIISILKRDPEDETQLVEIGVSNLVNAVKN